MPTTALPQLDEATLTPVVRGALGCAGVEVGEWVCTPFSGSYGAGTAGIFRVEGSASEPGSPGALPWSLVLKICRAPEPAVDPAGWSFGPREALAY